MYNEFSFVSPDGIEYASEEEYLETLGEED